MSTNLHREGLLNGILTVLYVKIDEVLVSVHGATF
jgi:hypothetical protein